MSSTVAAADAAPRVTPPSARNARWRRVGMACAGPALIVAGVLFTLRGFAFHPLLTNDHPDILAFWLPRFSFLGRELSAGHLPLWNPNEMLGYRFAADPQSGWLYVPPMLLFSLLSPGAAIRAFIVFNPLLAGLGLFWFLRKESLSRPVATVGGLCLGMLMSTSDMAIGLPFAGFLGWTTIVLAGASGYRHADRWSRRLGWLAVSAFAWSQVASAHMSHGLVMCSLLLAAFLIATSVASVRSGEITRWTAVGRTGLFLVAMPLASLAILIPRLASIGSSSLHRGYDALGQPVRSTAHITDRPLATNGVWATWPLAFGSAPGAYVGAVMLLAVLFAWRDRARRALVLAFGGCLLLTWLLMLNVVVTAGWFQTLLLKVPFGDVYLHNPGRMRYLSMIAIPILGAVGLQGLRDRPMSASGARRALAAGVALLLGLPLLAGGLPYRFILLAVAMVAAVPTLYWLATARKRWAMTAVVAVVGIELLASAVYSGLYRGGTIYTGLETGERPNLVPQVLEYPDLSETEFLRPTAFVDIIRNQPDRYLTYVPPAASFDKGYLFTQRPQDWPALAMERGTLFGIPDVLGYNPVQLPRYWTYIRATNSNPVFYNASVLGLPSLQNVRLMGVRYLIVPSGVEAIPEGRVVASADDYDLVQVYGWEPRVSLVDTWTQVDRPADALLGVLDPAFDPARIAYVERDPGISSTPSATPGVAEYREVTPEDVRITVTSEHPALVVVRNSYDARWSATVDGAPAPLLATDYLVQGVAVPSGTHEIRLVYRDDDVTRGALAGIVIWVMILLSIGVTLIRGTSLTERASPARLLLLSFLMLFVELGLIRWAGAYVIYLSFFTNFVLLASFLGVGVGFIRAGGRRNLFLLAPSALTALILFLALFPVEGGRVHGELQLVGGFGWPPLPTWLSLSVIFALSFTTMAAIAEGVARAFGRFEPLEAYRLDILGSILGILAFSALSLLQAPPLAWGIVVAAIFVGMMGRSRVLQLVPLAVALLVLGVLSFAPMTHWSPYYRVMTTPVGVDGSVRISVNGRPHQRIMPMTYMTTHEEFRFEPYVRAPQDPLTDVLIIGAGSGNDVAVALSQGAAHVDAVEIDPLIYRLGRELHPEHPYQDPRVSVHIEDGRAFLHDTDRRYDLVLFAIPDSLTVLAGQSSLRLESYLFTEEALREVRTHLKPNGVVSMYHYFLPVVTDRYADTLDRVFGVAPCLDISPGAGPRPRTVLTVAMRADELACDQVWSRPAAVPEPDTDDHPFPYLAVRGIPGFYQVTLLLILLASALVVRVTAGPFRQMGEYLDLFFMGAAFLLLETTNVVHFALLFGTTWFVNALVFAGILVSVYLAIEVTRRFRFRRPSRLYVVLFATLVLAWAVPPDLLLGLDFIPRFGAAVALGFAPVFLANLIFADRFRDVGSSTIAFGTNLLGAIVGGVLEYGALVVGYRALLIVVAALYGLALVTGRSHLTAPRPATSVSR